MIIEKITLGSIGENCYFVGDPQCMVVIDPGDEGEKILTHIQEKDYRVQYVVLTHCHYDHIGAAAAIVEATGASLLIGAKERSNYFDRHVSFCGYFAKMPTLLEPDVLLNDGDVITVGPYTFQVIHTPGHTSGSLCLLCENDLFSGDTIFYRTIGRADFPTGSLRDLVKSIKEKLFILSDSVRIHPGHGEDSTIGFEKQYNEVYKWEKQC
ncbi:MAG: MBL fold metallo-hydrolase [Ruminococcaceae bacterium]|nr:MBL fold metallo-hydrolase [Oscillospiraceae bacterium]